MARRRKTLSDEDQQLWDLVKQSAEPLHTVSYVPPAPIVQAKLPEVNSPRPVKSFVMNGRPEPRLRFDLAADPMQPLSRVPQVLDKRTHDKLRKGKKAPEARIDLHGMTAAQAHGALRGFILSSHARGLRLVLVITGKGNTTRDEIGIMPTRNGVLRHALPQWLGTPDMHPMILQISSAHLRHGGGGAYYVYLKKKGRS
ncbi:MAG: Smr/MutS family protein [Rhodobacteraceae bacterium]|nr:Smr/MutS family protein [Paracoccaceae bacterium]